MEAKKNVFDIFKVCFYFILNFCEYKRL